MTCRPISFGVHQKKKQKNFDFLFERMFRLIISILVLIFNVFLLAFPRIVLAASREGLLLWFNNVLPALLPFIATNNILVALGFPGRVGRIIAPVMGRVFGLPGAAGFAVVAGFSSGYPVGAKVVADLHRRGEVSVSDGQRLLAFCNNAGPLFIVGVVGVGLFGSSRVGYLLWGVHVAAALVLGLAGNIVRKKNVTAQPNPSPPPASQNFGTVLGEAIKNAMESMVFIGGFIIFFSVFVAVIAEATELSGMAGLAIAGLAEVTGGLRQVSAAGGGGWHLAAASFFIGFGGFAIHAQTFHFTAGMGVRVLPYLAAKLVHGILAAGLTIIIYLYTGWF